MVSRERDWLRQSLRDLEMAKKALEHNFFEWACFISQQAAEKAVKALYQKLGIEVWGHSISRMLHSLPSEYKLNQSMINKAKELDRHYIPTRYPNFHPEGSPSDYYTKEDAERAIKYAEEIIRFCKDKII